MSRRVSLPGADELFRVTGGRSPLTAAEPDLAAPGARAAGQPAAERAPQSGWGSAAGDLLRSTGAEPRTEPRTDSPVLSRELLAEAAPGRDELVDRTPPARVVGRRRAHGSDRRPTGRERHDEKITVYVSAEELIDLEGARLVLRGEHGLAVDRGRIVREAVNVVLADLEAKGEQSILVRRLRGL